MTEFAQMVRVDHAGEHGAVRIYEGQLRVFDACDTKQTSANLIRHMAAQEQAHLDYFDQLIIDKNIRPTLLSPLWHSAGFALGVATALMGEKAAMACTDAVEEVIDAHYAEQIEALDKKPEHASLAATLKRFRVEEAEHRQTAIEQGSEEAFAAPLLTSFIRSGCRLAIALAKHI